MNKELYDYIDIQRKGFTPDAVTRVNLHQMNKWSMDEIDQAMNISKIPTDTMPVVDNVVVPAPLINTVTPEIPPQTFIPTPLVPDTVVEVPPQAPVKHGDFGLKFAFGALFVLILLGGGYFALAQMGVLGGVTYKEDNIFSGIMSKYADIQTSTYTSSITIEAVARDKDARPPFVDKEKQDSGYPVADYTSYFPPEMKIDASLGLTADWKNKNVTDLKFNIQGKADSPDLSYKVNFDGIKKGEKLYIKINNIPPLPFVGDLSAIKGQWISFGKDALNMFGQTSTSTEDLTVQSEKELKFLKKVANLADKHHLIRIISIESETIDGQRLQRYQIKIRKESILPIYQELKSEYGDSDISYAKELFSEKNSEYLTSEDFNKSFANYEKNAHLSILVDKSGYPVILEYKLRVVPPDTSTKFKDKQINLLFKVTASDINKPIVITAPENAKTYEEAMTGLSTTEIEKQKKDSEIKRNLSEIRISATVYYEYNRGSYGPSVTTCTSGMFSDTSSGVKTYIDRLTASSSITCHSNNNNYAVSANLLNPQEYWCVDSTGNSKLNNLPLASGATSCN